MTRRVSNGEQGEPGIGSLAALLETGRSDAFVGRKKARDFVERALGAGHWTCPLVYLYGGGGVGKTRLLAEMVAMCRAAGMEVASLPACQGGAPEPGARARVVVIDDLPRTAGDDLPLEHLLRQVPVDGVLLLSSARPPPLQWQSDAGFRALAHVIRVGNFSLEEVCSYLEARGVPTDRAPEVMSLTWGHPLTVAWTCTAMVEGPDGVRPEALARLSSSIRDAFPAALRAVLDVVAVVRCIREDVLATLGEDVGPSGEVFEMLDEQWFMESCEGGLQPLPIVRMALQQGLRWRNPASHDALRERARGHCIARLGAASHHPSTRHYRQALVSDLLHVERGDLAGLVARGYGAVRTADGRVSRCVLDERKVAEIELTPLDEAPCDPDHAERTRAFLKHEGALGGGEWAQYARVRLSGDDRDGPVAALVTLATEVLAPGAPAITFVDAPDPVVRVRIQRAGAAPLTGTDLWVADWRRIEPHCFIIGLSDGPAGAGRSKPAPVPYRIFGRDEFATEVRQALRDYHDQPALRHSALLRSRVVHDVAAEPRDVSAQVSALRDLCSRAAASLGEDERHVRLRRVLRCAYLEPAPSQERAAERLALPLSTFRRYLNQAVGHVVEVLWRAELEGAGALPERHTPSEPSMGPT